MLRFRPQLLAVVALCVACGDSPEPWSTKHEQWFERVEMEGRSDAPEVLIAWDGTGPARSRLADSVQFALWSDGQAIWREGDLLETSSHRVFRCSSDELSDLRATLAAQLADQFLWGPQTACAGSQLILWREGQSIRGVMSDAFLESLELVGSSFGRVTTTVPQRAEGELDAGPARRTDSERAAVRARLSLEAAIAELVARHPEARPTSAVRLASR